MQSSIFSFFAREFLIVYILTFCLSSKEGMDALDFLTTIRRSLRSNYSVIRYSTALGQIASHFLPDKERQIKRI